MVVADLVAVADAKAEATVVEEAAVENAEVMVAATDAMAATVAVVSGIFPEEAVKTEVDLVAEDAKAAATEGAGLNNCKPGYIKRPPEFPEAFIF